MFPARFLQTLDRFFHGKKALHELLFCAVLLIDLHPFFHADEMRRDKKPGARPVLRKHMADRSTDASLSIAPRHMDHRKITLRMPQTGEQPLRMLRAVLYGKFRYLFYIITYFFIGQKNHHYIIFECCISFIII